MKFLGIVCIQTSNPTPAMAAVSIQNQKLIFTHFKIQNQD
jgi:hypothetical protein